MGRQAYLDKIAFGRSAFEPTQVATQSTEYVQLESSQSEIPRAYLESNVNNYIQLYDERGNPVNPRSHDYGKRLRKAQNDVLASVGVVEWRRLPTPGPPGSYEERLEGLEAEDTAGNAFALISTLAENVCTWWMGAVRYRILTFRIQDALPFARIVASEFAVSGHSIIYTGFASRIFSTMCIQTFVYITHVHRPIDRLLLATRASSKTRRLFRRTRSTLKFGVRPVLELLFYPFSYHACLQRLGIISALPLLPHWKSLIPFSNESPLLPLSLHYNASASAMDFLKAVLTSPAVLVCADHFYERWIHAAIYDAVEISVIRPDNADVESPETPRKDRTTAILGLRRQSPLFIRDAINRLLVAIGWGQSIETLQKPSVGEGQTIDVGGTQITNMSRLELPVAHTEDQNIVEPRSDVVSIPIETIVELIRPTTPPTPAFEYDQDENDPRIRITSREGIVEMEVRLPPRVLSSHTEVVPAQSVGSRVMGTNPHHRVTQLSTEPSQMIGAIVKSQIVGLAVLPLKLVVLRLIASHYYARRGGPVRTVMPLSGFSDLSWRTVGTHASRIALCGALELSIDLTLWGLQYFAVTNVGKNFFGWGTL
ncbi:hypothetical protein P153DRAFT_280785 [Dothidotthia symphoricarpi CBS 119687]|uniref:Uncharacterized protein n=1 Tax=Dothidotthia symphoricarpi CBS 119687 TaxID=1392245 RepID=A0A6A6ATS5_9PLEO|nr:uncharacterized protein P153DRAFT_280785 [Dothidotthia symphoricarpi CBS 119687]KAF2134237.1 hypothetical protein P153DRAFT_280785 [Dothidotthia symphoricarpi CBS 119687]